MNMLKQDAHIKHIYCPLRRLLINHFQYHQCLMLEMLQPRSDAFGRWTIKKGDYQQFCPASKSLLPQFYSPLRARDGAAKVCEQFLPKASIMCLSWRAEHLLHPSYLPVVPRGFEPNCFIISSNSLLSSWKLHLTHNKGVWWGLATGFVFCQVSLILEVYFPSKYNSSSFE